MYRKLSNLHGRDLLQLDIDVVEFLDLIELPQTIFSALNVRAKYGARSHLYRARSMGNSIVAESGPQD